jgi:general secretion pathway protein C
MLSVLHSFYKPIHLTLLALLGLACGHLINTVLQINLRPEITDEPVRAQSAVVKPQKSMESVLNLILQNHVFDANSRSATATMTPADKDDAQAAVPRAELKLFGTVVAGERSHILLQVNNDLKRYHLGDEIPGEGIIEEILRKQVLIRSRDKSLTTLTLQEKPPGSTAAAVPRGETGQESAGEIKKVGENRWLISQNIGESVRANFSDQMRFVQMQPRTVAGKTDGFQIRHIDPRSVLSKMGLQRGDVIIDVNNTRLDSPEKGLQIVQQLREARQITLAIERNRQPMSFSYEIQ